MLPKTLAAHITVDLLLNLIVIRFICIFFVDQFIAFIHFITEENHRIPTFEKLETVDFGVFLLET